MSGRTLVTKCQDFLVSDSNYHNRCKSSNTKLNGLTASHGFNSQSNIYLFNKIRTLINPHKMALCLNHNLILMDTIALTLERKIGSQNHGFITVL